MVTMGFRSYRRFEGMTRKFRGVQRVQGVTSGDRGLPELQELQEIRRDDGVTKDCWE